LRCQKWEPPTSPRGSGRLLRSALRRRFRSRRPARSRCGHTEIMNIRLGFPIFRDPFHFHQLFP